MPLGGDRLAVGEVPVPGAVARARIRVVRARHAAARRRAAAQPRAGQRVGRLEVGLELGPERAQVALDHVARVRLRVEREAPAHLVEQRARRVGEVEAVRDQAVDGALAGAQDRLAVSLARELVGQLAVHRAADVEHLCGRSYGSALHYEGSGSNG